MTEESLARRIDAAARAVAELAPLVPRMGMVLGSGLGGASLGMEDPTVIPYSRIPHFPTPSVAGHSGEVHAGTVSGVPVIVLSGRVHLYEGRDVHEVTMGVRTLARLGCEVLVVTNAAGSTRPELRPGALVRIVDHINLTGVDPTRGSEPAELGDRFVNMTGAYDAELGLLAERAAADVGVELARGVYAASRGPCYETPAEVSMIRGFGADLVGMSTVPEVIAARHAGMRVVGMSCVTNLAAGIEGSHPDHREVEQVAAGAGGRLARVVVRLLELVGRSS
jgi:inosine/guanosine/xanthosine phosphorylase family protein